MPGINRKLAMICQNKSCNIARCLHGITGRVEFDVYIRQTLPILIRSES